MAIYRSVQMSFWTDPEIVDDYTPEDKLLLLYILTNPHTNLSGCYEISFSQIAYETGFTQNKVNELMKKAESVYKTVCYSRETKELLILNWSKYNWTTSEKLRKPLLKEIENIKNPEFKNYLMDIYTGSDLVRYPIDTVSDQVSTPIDTTVSVSVIDNINIDNKVIGNNNINTVNTDNKVIGNNKKSKKKKEYKEKEKEKYFPDDEELNQAFLNYLEMRNANKSKMTDAAINLEISELTKLSSSPSGIMDNDLAIDILNQSIRKGWKGVYPLSGNRTTHRIKPSEDNDNRETDNIVAPDEDEELFGPESNWWGNDEDV